MASGIPSSQMPPSQMLSQTHPEVTDPILMSDWHPKASAGMNATQRIGDTQRVDEEIALERDQQGSTLTNIWLPPVTRHYSKEPQRENRGLNQGSPRRGQAGLAATREWAPALPQLSSRNPGALTPRQPAAPHPKHSRRARLVEHSKRELADAKAAIKRGETALACSKLNNLIESHSKNAALRTLRAQTLLAEGYACSKEAAKIDEKLRNLNMNSSPRVDHVRDLETSLRQAEGGAAQFYQDALGDAKRAISLSKDESAKASYLAGLAAGKLGLPDEGMAFLQVCLRHNPKDERYLRAFEQYATDSRTTRPYRAHGEHAYRKSTRGLPLLVISRALLTDCL